MYVSSSKHFSASGFNFHENDLCDVPWLCSMELMILTPTGGVDLVEKLQADAILYSNPLAKKGTSRLLWCLSISLNFGRN